jgi:DNA-binding response OmpR family regulator
MNTKILIVDDNETVRTLLKISLRGQKFDVSEAKNGLEAYQMLDQVTPDLIISDILMPQMDGFEFCRKVRENGTYAHIPFIFLSSLGEASTELRGYRTGADDYLVKSNLTKQELIKKIEELLSKNQRAQNVGSKIDEGLSGSIEAMSLIELVQLLSINKKNGILHFTDNKENKGDIFFKDGNISHAFFGQEIGEKAIYEMIVLNEGKYQFNPGDIPAETPVTITAPAMTVIMDCCRIMDEKEAENSGG